MRLAFSGTFQHHKYSEESEHFPPRWIPEFYLPAILAGLLGVGVIDVAYADTDEVCVSFFICMHSLMCKY